MEGVSGTWKALTDNVNMMANNLTEQVRNIAEVTTAVAEGDFSKKITVEVKGEILSLKNTINVMVDQLSSFAAEVTRVAREVGTEGQLGGQANVAGVSGTWKDLTDNVNTMADNLTNQVRGIAKVVTAVAVGNLKQKLTLEAKGEIADLADTINEMTDTLATFADQVTNVAREVGIEGKLGAQANVPGAAGIWRDLTDNVNELAANLTTQVRAIAEVATAVTEGDLTRSITADARGEVAILKDNINEMIGNLRNTTKINEEQNWLKTNLAQFASMLQGQRDLLKVGNMILSELAPLVNAQHGIFYMAERSGEDMKLKLLSSYAFKERKQLSTEFRLGEGLVGQCALEKQRILMTEVPDDYVQINSGLGHGTPLNIVVLPIAFEEELQAVIELASFTRFSDVSVTFLDQLTENIGIMLNTIAATMRTEDLLKESQSMAEELQNQQDELKQTNEELEEKAIELEKQKDEVEHKNAEVELARKNLEDKAQELALTSKYKSEFLANMSHELRTPLNSLLILSNILSENEGTNLNEQQVEYAQTIHTSGMELLGLINEILDLSKIESGTMTIDTTRVEFDVVAAWAKKAFSEGAREKGLGYTISLGETLPQSMVTDEKRLQQVLKNLLSNAFKFTEEGEVRVDIAPADSGWNIENEILNLSEQVIAFAVQDTGIGIPEDKQQIVFEAFQQADGTTSRKYGGTGLGLSITREIVRLLGGDISVFSKQGEGCLFTVYLPQTYIPRHEVLRPEVSSGQTVRRLFSPASGLDSTSTAAGDTESEHPGAKRTSKDGQSGGPVQSRLPDLDDDRQHIGSEDRSLLIIEDDLPFAKMLCDTARQRNFKALVALCGQDGLSMAREYQPDAITLDLNLPDMAGITVLDMLKHHPRTRHIPVHVVSIDEESLLSYKFGAISHITKPLNKKELEEIFQVFEKDLSRKIKTLLVVEDDETQQKIIRDLIGTEDVEVVSALTGEAALTILQEKIVDCIVLDLGLPDISGFELIEAINETPHTRNIPMIVYTGKDLSKKEETELRRLSESIIIKDVQSMDRLLDETSLFLHRVVEKLPREKKEVLQTLRLRDPELAEKKVIIVDDDVRNIFALTAILEGQQMEVLYAEGGEEGVTLLKKNPDTDLVLMDIMMPGMDGYEAIGEIRKDARFGKLPVIALTAKAMKGDREKCILAGASDYIAKPVEKEQLLSLLRVWLYR